MTCRLKSSWIRDEGFYRHRGNGADTRNCREAPHILILLGDNYDLALKLLNPCCQTVDLINDLFKSKTRGRRQAGVTFIPNDRSQRLYVSDPRCRDDAELAHVSAQGIDRLCSLAHEQSTGAENHDRGLLIRRLYRHEPHGFAGHGFADCFSIGRIGLAAFDEWLHILRGDQANVVTESCNFTRPMVRTPAGLHSDKAWWKFCEEAQNLAAA